MKVQAKKWKEDMTKIRGENADLRKRLKDQSRLMGKIEHHSFKGHLYKSAVRHRELEYLTKREFYQFYMKLRDSFEMILNCLKDAFKRDAKIVQNLLESHMHPSGKAIMVNKDCHAALKQF